MTQSLPPPGAQVAQLAAAEEELLVEVEINGQRMEGAALVLRTTDGRFHVTAASLLAWRLRVPSVPVRERAGEAWFALEAIEGLSVRFDGTRQRLALAVPPAAFASSALEATRPERPRADVAVPGAFLNYSLAATRTSGESTYGAVLEAGFFGPYGVLVTGLLASRDPLSRGTTRLDTTYTRDLPDRLESLRIGDVTSASGAWGRSLRIGGVQWGTNFSLQPGFVAYPTLTARGETALPSTVDVFVNNALVAQQPVPPGPFSISNIPTVTGAGDVQLVVRDLLGREVLISQPFYGASDLLAPGLSQYSVELGAEREDFGIESFGYDRAIASATWRRGFTDSVTAEARGEATARHAAVGGAVDWLTGRAGVLSATTALSRANDKGTGWLAGLGFTHQSAAFGATLRARWSGADWTQAGATDLSPVPRAEIAATASTRLGRAGSLSVAYVEQRYRRERNDTEFVSVNWSTPLAYGAAFTLVALRDFASRSNTLSLNVTVPFGQRDTFSAGWTRQRGGAGDDDYGQVSIQRSLPLGEGFGYRVLARSERDVQAGIAWQGAYGTYSAEATRFEGSHGVRLTASGGLGLLGGHAFASREINDSFGVVRVGEFDGVGVLVENQPVARTSGGGYAVLPRLRAYDVNRIAIAQDGLPLDASVGSLALQAVPAYRSGVLIEFPVRRSRGATMIVVRPDGTPVPPGATAEVEGSRDVFPVGEGGLAYLTGLAARNRVVVRHPSGRCAFDVAFPATDDPLPDLGRFTCAPLP